MTVNSCLDSLSEDRRERPRLSLAVFVVAVDGFRSPMRPSFYPISAVLPHDGMGIDNRVCSTCHLVELEAPQLGLQQHLLYLDAVISGCCNHEDVAELSPCCIADFFLAKGPASINCRSKRRR